MTENCPRTLQFFRRAQPWPFWNRTCTYLGMQLATRSTKFVRFMVEAATVRPMLSALLEMKRSRVRAPVVTAPLEPTRPLEVVPLKAA